VVHLHRSQMAIRMSVTIRPYYRMLLLDPKPRLSSRVIDNLGTTGLDRRVGSWFITVDGIILDEH
jgi:hypothetical protein